MKSNNKKLAFTLAEVLVTVAVIGCVASIIIPSLEMFKPNKNKTMFKKSYQMSVRIISDLINDHDLYRDQMGVVGFDDVSRIEYNNTDFYGDNSSQISDDAKRKFCYLFAANLNTVANSRMCTTNFVPSPSVPCPWTDRQEPNANSFVSSDGIVWALPFTNFTTVANSGATPSEEENGVEDVDLGAPAWKVIWVDVNGKKPPNIADSLDLTARCTNNVDRFPIFVRADGKVALKSVCAREYMHDTNIVNTNVSGNKNEDFGSVANIRVFADGSGHVGNSVTQADGNSTGWFEGDKGTYTPPSSLLTEEDDEPGSSEDE